MAIDMPSLVIDRLQDAYPIFLMFMEKPFSRLVTF